MDELTVGMATTLFLGDYETVKPAIEQSVTIEDGDDEAQVYDELSDKVHRLWIAQAWWMLGLAFDRRKINGGETYMIEKQMEAIEAEAEAAGVSLS